MFHAGDAANRDSISAHGLDWRRMGGTTSIAGSPTPRSRASSWPVPRGSAFPRAAASGYRRPAGLGARPSRARRYLADAVR